MPNLRDMLDGNTISAAAPQAKNPSPVAKHISEHVDDPVGRTKDAFTNLTQKKLEYDLAREETQRNLAPVQTTINHISTTHGLTPGIGTPGMQPAGMNPMNMDNPDQFDEDGNPIDPMQQGGVNKQAQMPGQPGVPGMPGVGPQQSMMPPKMGMPTPGKPGAGTPQPKGSGPAKPAVAKPAAKPAGKSAGGAKKPGGGSGREVKVHVTAGRASGTIASASHSLEHHMGMAALTSMSALASNLDTKSDDSKNAVAYNPVIRACSKCNKIHAGACSLDAAGTSSGAKHRLSTKGQNRLSKKEKKAHYNSTDAMEANVNIDASMQLNSEVNAGGPGSGRHAQFAKLGYNAGKPRNAAYHEVLTKAGFTHHGNHPDGDVSGYSHRNGTTAFVNNTGSWHGTASDKVTHKEGNSIESLTRFANK